MPEAEPAAPPETKRAARIQLAAMALIIAGGLWLMFSIVRAWHVPAGDGLQYYALSQQLAKDGRFAYKPAPAPLAYTRMPGYPLFLAYLAVRTAGLPIEAHLVRATQANVILSLGTALMVFFILRRYARSRWTALLGLAITLFCPLLILLACYGLSETLTVFLCTLELFLALQAMRGRRTLLYCALCGAVAAYAQITRVDSASVAPAVLLAIWSTPIPWKRRLLAVAVCGVTAAACFSPWLIRNQVQFGRTWPVGLNARSVAGDPQPTSPLDWTRTWATGIQGEAYLDVCIYFGNPLDPNRPGVILPQMYDDEAERAQIVALFNRYNRERLSPAVSKGFDDLAAAHAHRNRFRTYVSLPLRRIYHLWSPVPEYELPLRIAWLHLPQSRDWFGRFDKILFVFALAGVLALILVGRDRARRRLGLILLLPILLRTVLFGYVVPAGVTERYIVEIFPLLIVFASFGVEFAVQGGRTLIRRVRKTP